jgi:hypothetical protein
MLGVVLNRADVKMDDNYYYYTDRHRAAAAAQATEEVGVAEPSPAEDGPEMIYIEEDGVS